jgi:hypothetical protein
VLRASVAAEAAGIPTVSLVCEGFEGQARATARGLGFDGVALAVLPGHVDTQSIDQLTDNVVRHTVPAIIAGLTNALDSTGDRTDEPAALDVVLTSSLEAVHDHFAARGWSDGLPFVPPTIDRVEAMLDPLGFDPWRTVGVARPSGRDMTLWSIAVNGVMAGCRPEHMSVLVAIARTFADTRYGVEHSGNTTGADPLVILDGPIADELALNHGPGAMRHGGPNATIGRFVRLYLRNVHGFTPDEHDKATFGNPAKSVLAEDLECLREIGWGPLSSGFGFGRSDDAVVIGRINSGVIIGSVFGGTPDEIVPYLADGLARVAGWDLTHVYGLGQGQQRPLLVLSPLLARVFGRAGWSRRDVQHALFRHARIPARRFEQLIGEWSNLTAGRRTLTELAAAGLVPPVFAEGDDPDRLVPVVDDPSKILIAVTGDPNRASAFAMSHDGPHGDWTATAVDRTPSADLLCRVPATDGGTAECG